MRSPNRPELLNLFADASANPAPDGVRALLALACPGEPIDDETPGERHARLISLRRLAFGRRMLCLTTCPTCSEVLELELDALDFEAPPSPKRITIEHAGRELSFRLPTMRDIEMAARSSSPLEDIVDSCAIDPEADIAVEDTTLHEALSRAFDAADPLGRIVIEARCPSCGTTAQPMLDPTNMVLREFAAVAHRLEVDIHVLAGAYGWSEDEILALPDARRRRYVDRVIA